MEPTLAEGPARVKHMFESPLDSEQAFGHRGRVRRTYVRRRMIGCGLVLGLWLSIPAAADALAGNAAELRGARYVVQPGDTLWDIAIEHAPSKDPREVIHAIGAANRIETGIVPGQELVLPVLD
jgi:hypothetical protein